MWKKSIDFISFKSLISSLIYEDNNSESLICSDLESIDDEVKSCDADSSALARYVLALLKKEKPINDLKNVMVEQLDVFLAEETKPFVERLFNAITSEEYLPTMPTPATDNAADNNNPAAAIIGTDRELTPPLDDTKTKELFNKIEESNSTPNNSTAGGEIVTEALTTTEPITTDTLSPSSSSAVPIAPPPPLMGPTKSVSPFKATSDKENQPRESRRRRASLRSRSRSRSRSNDRISRRSRSRDRRQNEREKNTRQFRNKSPPLHVDRRDRRGPDRRRGPHMNDERSPRVGFTTKNRTKSHSASRSRSPSVERRKGGGGGGVSPSGAMINRSPVYSNENSKRQRCRDFDEKGYCVRGETCPWDHGINPVVFEGINNSALISMSLREYNPDAPDLWSRGSSSAVAPSGGNAGNTSGGGSVGNPFSSGPRNNFSHKGGNGAISGVYPRAGAGGAGFRPSAPIFPFPLNAAATPLQRELIPVPVVDANGSGGDISASQTKRRFELEDSVAIAEGPSKRKLPLSSRLGPRITNIQNNCSLELRKVPRGMNTIAHLNNHFAKFGKIVNIQISYDDDPEAAIVTFSTHAEANVAYRSTEAVLNNRFIKVFWHSQQDGMGGSSGGNSQMTNLMKDDGVASAPVNGSVRKNSQYHLSNIPAVPTPAADAAKTPVSMPTTTPATPTPATTTVSNSPTIVAAAHVPPPSLRVKNNTPRVTPATTAIIRKKQEEQAKAVVQLANGLRKRKHELLQGYVKQMKSAVELVERCEPNDPQRIKTVETIKILQATIDKLRKEIATEQEQMAAQIQNQQPPVKKTKEQQKKELLDIELELFAQQQEGNDTTAIQKRLEDLQRSLGIGPGTKPHFPLSGARSNKHIRPTLPAAGSTSVDRRPKSIVVTGFASEDCDSILAHFKSFGEVMKHDIEKSIPQLIATYATRSNAEQAVLRGKVFKDKRLQIAWAPTVQSSTSHQVNKSISDNNITEGKSIDKNVTSNNNGNSDMETTDTLPELRLEDEEEDDESEDRSWRR
ncbi:zinc finger protein swm isoform X2 [Episyrphus balteatus]|uniref:zinc finger protein swm isoform X2 n=1 Tax=Episyrphus balteatus TaxID=286459 RepID=UPI002486C07C|nr:zinc finger protein swm isoform X2 [Episyrphus balteatus]